MSDWVYPTNWFASEAELLRFCGFWGFFALLSGLEVLFPAMVQSAQRGLRWPTNIGLGLLNMTTAPLVPLSGIAAAEWAHKAGVGLFNFIETPWLMAALATVAIRSLAGYGVHVL